MSDADEAIKTLPFVRTKPNCKGREFWHVTPTGEHDVDFSLGRGYAIEAVEMAVATRFPGLVCWVLREMGRHEEWRSVESGFMRGLADLACVTMSLARGDATCACVQLGQPICRCGRGPWQPVPAKCEPADGAPS